MAAIHSNPSSAQNHLACLKGKITLVGLTGGIGSGKTTVSDLLAKLGAGVIDTDRIAHQCTGSGGKAIPLIRDAFGSDFIDAKGALDRPKMRHLVFENAHARLSLEKIVHPLIQQETVTQAMALALTQTPYIVFVVPLLIESAVWIDAIDFLVVVDCPEETQIDRVMQRSNMSRTEIEAILRVQASRQDRLNKANFVVQNQSTPAELEAQVLSLHQQLLKISEKPRSSS